MRVWELRIYGGFRVEELGSDDPFFLLPSGFVFRLRVWSLGLRVYGLWFMVNGFWFRLQG